MDALLLGARLVLAAVFAVASAGKLVDRSGSRQAMVDFGVPTRLAGPLGGALPLVELAVAIALIPTASAWVAAVGALALLTFFVFGISQALARGLKPDCHCFGQLHSAPAGWTTIVRNIALAAIAGFVISFGFSDPGASAVGWIDDLTTAEQIGAVLAVAAFALLAAQGWFMFQMLTQNGRLLLRLEALEKALADGAPLTASAMTTVEAAGGLPIGSLAPGFSLPGLDGDMVTLDSLVARGKPALVVFSDPKCGACNNLIPELVKWQATYADEFNLAVISRGTPAANAAPAGEQRVPHMLLQVDREVADAYRCYGTPGAVLIGRDGAIASSLAQGVEAIRQLVDLRVAASPGMSVTPLRVTAKAGATAEVGHSHVGQPGLNIGQPAPSLKLPDLRGEEIDLARFEGNKVIVLFWNPRCGFCQRILPDLKAWESDPPPAAPRLLVISTGAVEENQAMALQSPIGLEQRFSAGRAFGAGGTPSAVLIDERGNVASQLAAGGPAVLSLLYAVAGPPQ